MKKVPNSIYNYIIREYSEISVLSLGFISDLDITEETALVLIYWQNFMHQNIKKTVPCVNIFCIQ